MPTLSFGSRCAHCGQHAPLVLRGFEARCVACGKGRVPMSAPSVSLAGQPSRIGGAAATLLGWTILV
ncbi:MAG TPA: hypothetical protein VER33_10475, partial [Polyangiaceae bacterium]|nr:hypothetical protein [Polyangiaceae bacterium]